MAIKYYEKYPQRWESPSQDYPQGAFKNLSALGEQDGSYLEASWLNDQSGFFGALLRNAEMTPNGLVDTAQKSQFYEALLVCARKAVDLSGYYTKPQVDAEILANKTEVANEWGDSLDKTLSQDFLYNNKKLTPTVEDITVDQSLSGDYDVNLLGRTIVSQVEPTSTIGSNGFVKFGNISYPQRDTLDLDVSKITDMNGYTAWAQDKAYVAGNRIIVWVNHGDAHLDGQLIPAYVMSEDGGSTWSNLILPFGLLIGHTTWCAGFDGEYEYVIVRKESDLSNTVYRRKPDFGGYYDEIKSWEKLDSVFPRPVEATDPNNKLIMIHSFTKGRGGSIVVGAHYGSQWVGGFQSFDKGESWTAFTLNTSNVRSEPTIKYDAETDKYYGFIRNGAEVGNPAFFSGSDLNNTLLYSAPFNYFGVGKGQMTSTPMPLYVENGYIHAFVGYRSGSIEHGTPTKDYEASQFLLRADIREGNNIWNHAEVIRLGSTSHIETGGASALSVGSVVKYGDKLLIYTGSEERTGTSPNPSTNTRVNRIANIIQIALPINNKPELMSDNSQMKNQRANTSCVMMMYNGNMVQPIGLPVFRRYKDLTQLGLDHVNSNSNSMVVDFGNGSGSFYGATTGSYISFLGNDSGLRIDVTSGTPQVVNKEYGLLYSFRAIGIVPRADGASDIGITGTAFNTIHLRNQPVITSDSRKKKNITPIDSKYIEVISKIDFKQFNFKEGDGSLHFGIIAQDWIKACSEVGIDPYESGVLVGSEEEGYSVRYGELQNLLNAYILNKIK